MKKIILSLSVIAMAAMGVQAQQTASVQQHHRGHMHHRIDLVKKLHFSEGQQQQLATINSHYREQVTDLKKNEDITVRESKSRSRSLRKEHRLQI